MAVLYRKYRPQTFAEVLSQRHVTQTLKNQVATGQVSHAYLFTGTRGVGKTSIARILAKAVNCRNSNQGEPCGQCEVCQQIASGIFLDLVEIDAASNTGVDNIRDLIEHVKFSPSAGAYKVFIIDEVHMLSKGAFNALLKTLEEPPKHAIFILATTEAGKIPATIVSRTQRFDFRRMEPADLERHLEKILEEEKIPLSKEVARLVAQNADGSARDALSLLDKILTLGAGASLEDCQRMLGITDLAVCENLLELMIAGEQAKLPDFFNLLLEQGTDFSSLNRDFLEYLRKALVLKAAGKEPGLTGDRLRHLEGLLKNISLNELIFLTRLFLRSFKELAYSPNPQVPLLIAALEAGGRKAPAGQAQAKSQGLPGAAAGLQKKPAVEEKKQDEARVASAVLPETESGRETAGALPVSREEVEKHWEEVIINLKEINGPLASMVKGLSIQSAEGNTLTFGVKYLFHKQNLESPKNQAMIAQVFEKTLGKKVRIRACISKEDESAKASPTEALSDALKIFGGELVE